MSVEFYFHVFSTVVRLNFQCMSVFTFPVKGEYFLSAYYFSIAISLIQLKNQLAALYSSPRQSQKNSKLTAVDLVGGRWKTNTKETSLRTDQGCAPRIPSLRYNFVYCDVWTRWNVFSAKIMQVHVCKCH